MAPSARALNGKPEYYSKTRMGGARRDRFGAGIGGPGRAQQAATRSRAPFERFRLALLCKARGEGRSGGGFGSSPTILDSRRRGGARRGADSGFDSGWGAGGGDEANGCVESGEGVRDRRSESGRSESGPARPAKAEQAKAEQAKARRTERARHAPQPSAAAAPPFGRGGPGRFFEQMPGAGEGRRGAGRGRDNGGGEGKLGPSPQQSLRRGRTRPAPSPARKPRGRPIRAVGPRPDWPQGPMRVNRARMFGAVAPPRRFSPPPRGVPWLGIWRRCRTCTARARRRRSL